MNYHSDSWLLLRGLARSAQHWGEFPKRLGTIFPGSAVHCIDLPGNGEQYLKTTPTTVQGITDLIKADYENLLKNKIQNVSATRKTYLVSLSLGGMVAIDWISRSSHVFSGCVLINTSIGGVNPIYQRFQISKIPTFIKILLEKDISTREALILKLTSSNHKKRQEVLSKWIELASNYPIKYENVIRQLVAAARFKIPKQAPKMPGSSPLPILILSGKEDHLVNPDCSRKLHNHWASTYYEHPSAGHDLPLDDPDWTIQQIFNWRLSLN